MSRGSSLGGSDARSLFGFRAIGGPPALGRACASQWRGSKALPRTAKPTAANSGWAGRPRWLLAGLAALPLVAASCGSQEPPLPRRPAAVDVSLREYRFDYKPPMSSGRAVFRVRNDGKLTHELVLLPLPKDFPPIEQQLGGKRRRSVGTLAFLKPLRPGKTGVFAVDLQPGRYAMVCFLNGSDGISHARKGMASEFRIR